MLCGSRTAAPRVMCFSIGKTISTKTWWAHSGPSAPHAWLGWPVPDGLAANTVPAKTNPTATTATAKFILVDACIGVHLPSPKL